MEVRDWQGRTGKAWAAEWQRTDRSFGGLTERLLARSRDFKFERVVDIGCGAGELSLALARGRPHANITGVDISDDLVAAAERRGAHLSNVNFVTADAATWRPEPGEAPDLVVSRHGVMFFPDPVAAFANISSFSAAGANLMFSCFRPPAENPVFSEVAAVLPPVEGPAPDPRAPGPFAFADRDYTRSVLESGGWSDVRFEAVDLAMVTGAGPDPVEDAVSYWTSIGPAAERLSQVDDATRDEWIAAIRQLAQRHSKDRVVALKAAAWIVTAHRP
ncbi:methyltransferase domain-containing protein [Altererythrobacter salegens]|uniref:Methyltransferase domain-containing protein n=1 Tax=Croceibacterium salegens TaxID=1737568 RepID=A0A6I4SY00_9SPHN|nr:class I SAM-dependent methyltransferase [Croceibacterium salegens]MXO59192.1 methyltransferase domain-containing protein [Croceibacterium salegens]